MKRIFSILLAVVLLASCLLVTTPKVYATAKPSASRAIAIVFDNSGSMYDLGDQAWCRATYAMEVFASMLNKGDVLQIYPMWPITAGGKEYTMENPLQITDASQAATIRDIHTAKAYGTPIESIDCAINGLQAFHESSRYLIVLTDGDTFYKNNSNLYKDKTIKELDSRIQAHAGIDMSVMYLGIGSAACMPSTAESEYFVKKQAVNTEDVLSTLTVMCNQIFGRDSLPKSRISGNTIEFDISMSKLIVFVQGENIENLKITGGSVGQQIGSQQTKYSTKGAGNYKSTPDTSLQGMMVTYADCAAGTYNIEYSGTATSVEAYYEPDADLDFVFTDAEGSTVDPQSLYEGEYKVSFGMKDAKTGKLISSDLLGNPRYQGSYFIDGKEYPITHEGFSGSVDIPLKMGEKFEAKLTVTYLGGYTISKDSSDFGWPEGGIQVAPRPAGKLELEVSGGQEKISIKKLSEGTPYVIKAFYTPNGEAKRQLTGNDLKEVFDKLTWDANAATAALNKTLSDDQITISLGHKNPQAPQETACGVCRVELKTAYTAPGSNAVNGGSELIYDIDADLSALDVTLSAADEDYIVISEMAGKTFIAKLTMNGKDLTPEQFATLSEPVLETDGIQVNVKPDPASSSYILTLAETPGVKEGDYSIKLTATCADEVGRPISDSGAVGYTLSVMPFGWKVALFVGGLILLFIIIWIILHIKVMPRKVMTSPKQCSLTVGATGLDKGISYPTKRSGSTLSVLCKKGAMTFGLKMKVAPGDDSYLYKPSKSRSMVVLPKDVSIQGGGTTIKEANINGERFAIDPQTRRFGPVKKDAAKPIVLRNGAPVKWSGTLIDGGKPKSFSVTTKLDFKDK